MPFFDFHCHPGLKPQFADPLTKPSPWDFIDAKLALASNLDISINKLFNEVLNSQSNLTQLLQNEVRMVGLILHAPEKKIGQALAEKKIVNRGTVNLINRTQLVYLASGKHSFELINEELNWLNNAVSPIPGAKLKLLNRADEFDETDRNTIHGVIIVEGLHCFFDNPDSTDAREQLLANFNQFTSQYTVVSINICHMQQNQFCNHAHGIQFFNPAYFYPVQTGITTWGREMIQLMINKKILTDIKHMSLLARLELYNWFKDPAAITNFVQPIICTHAGTTGISFNDRAKYLLHSPVNKGLVFEVAYLKPQSRHDASTYHNCSSINLYDEDIENILLSGGIIGLSFDQRILGFADESVLANVTVPHDVEYISMLESAFFLGPAPATLPVWPDDTGVWTAEDFENLDPSLYASNHLRFLLNNIIHILWVANKHSFIELKEAARQICLGTDFDGLINAIDCCKQADGLQELKVTMRSGLNDLLHTTGLTSLDADELLENIFYNNGKDFMLGRLQTMRH